MSKKAIVFDMDGTLVDSLEELADATNYALVKCGYKVQPLENFKRYVGDGAKMLLYRATEKDLSEQEYKEIYDIFIKKYSERYCYKTKIYFNFEEVIERLKARGIKLAVVTNKMDFMAKEILNKLFGEDKFDAIFGQCDDYPTKPDPTAVRLAMKSMGVTADECLFVGDSDVDILTGKNANIKSVGALWGFRGKDELLKAGADYVIERPNEILDILD